MSITAKQLAEKLNISPAAVSMALNHKPGVSTETRKQIIEAAEKYGYDFTRINSKHPVTGSIYFILYQKHGAVVTDTPFFSELSEGVLEGCKKNGYKMKISYIYGDEELQPQLDEIQYSDCAGMILLGTEMAGEDIKPFLKLPQPLILLDSPLNSIHCDCIQINNIQGACMAANHLIKKKKKQPGYLKSAYAIGNFNERSDGFFMALKEHGMSANQSSVHLLTPSVTGAYADMLAILDRNEPLASCYFADNDLIAIGAIKALKKRGYNIPKDIAIIGFDNIPMSKIIEPTLTTIDVPKQYMGKLAAERLIARIQDPGLPPINIAVRTTLKERHSV